jgi:uncharacterized protein
MIKIGLSELSENEVIIEKIIQIATLDDKNILAIFRDPIEIYLKFKKNSEDVVFLCGWVKGQMNLICDRCLASYSYSFKSFIEVQYQRPDKENVPYEETLFEIDTEYFTGDFLDVSDVIRQTLILSIPIHALCNENCLGLCNSCGKSLKEGLCQCQELKRDSRWDALKKWKLD